MLKLTPSEVAEVTAVRVLLRSGDARTLRERAHLSRAELAASVQCHETAVMRWEDGTRMPRAAVALRLASVYAACAAGADVVEATS